MSAFITVILFFIEYKNNFVLFAFRACQNVTKLIMDTSLLFLSTIIDNPDLNLAFNWISQLEIIADGMYFPLTYASKFVQRFPSLTHVTIDVYSIDSCVPIVDIFLVVLQN